MLLPLAAICLVMAILKININPTSPSIVLNFADLLQRDPVITASPPQYMLPCVVESEAVPASAACAGGLRFRCAPARDRFAYSYTWLPIHPMLHGLPYLPPVQDMLHLNGVHSVNAWCEGPPRHGTLGAIRYHLHLVLQWILTHLAWSSLRLLPVEVCC